MATWQLAPGAGARQRETVTPVCCQGSLVLRGCLLFGIWHDHVQHCLAARDSVWQMALSNHSGGSPLVGSTLFECSQDALQQLTICTNCRCSCIPGHVLLGHRQRAHHMPCSPSGMPAFTASAGGPALGFGALRLASLHEVLGSAAVLCSPDSMPSLQCLPGHKSRLRHASSQSNWAFQSTSQADLTPALGSGALRLPSLHEVLSSTALVCAPDSMPPLQCLPAHKSRLRHASSQTKWAFRVQVKLT